MNQAPYKPNSSGAEFKTFDVTNLRKGCEGRTDNPHISTHVPGTVNVSASTKCIGSQVTVETSLSRSGWFIFRDSVTKKVSGESQVSVNVSLPCRWKPGKAPIEYVVISNHWESGGASAITRSHGFIKC